MKLKTLLTIFVFVALIVVFGLSALTFYGTYTWLEVNGVRWEFILSQLIQ